MASHYKDLIAWQRGVDLVAEVYRATGRFPKSEQFGLVNQLRRAAVSVPSNIAEGQGRLSAPEFRQFLGHARGSLSEVYTQIVIAQRLEYLREDDANLLFSKLDELGRLLNGLIRSIERQIEHPRHKHD